MVDYIYMKQQLRKLHSGRGLKYFGLYDDAFCHSSSAGGPLPSHSHRSLEAIFGRVRSLAPALSRRSNAEVGGAVARSATEKVADKTPN